MIGILVRRREQTENEVVAVDRHCSMLGLCGSYESLRSRRSYAKLPQNERKCWLARTRRLFFRRRAFCCFGMEAFSAGEGEQPHDGRPSVRRSYGQDVVVAISVIVANRVARRYLDDVLRRWSVENRPGDGHGSADGDRLVAVGRERRDRWAIGGGW
jgi:hypothetical protein